MVFSLFSRKSKSSRKPAQAIRVVDSTIRGPSTSPTQDPTEVQRELARRTAEKIDQIESEMIAAALPTPPAPKRVQERIEARRQDPAAAVSEPCRPTAATRPRSLRSCSIEILDEVHAKMTPFQHASNSFSMA